MELYQPFDLTTKTLEQFVDNKQLLYKMLQNKDTVELFFNRFPFEKLLNVTIMDNSNITLSIELIDLLSDYPEFYTLSDPFNYGIEFILINLSQVSGDCKQTVSLFQLLSKILHSNIETINDSLTNAFDRERILEVMLKIARLEVVNKANFVYYGPILNYLLEHNFPDSVCPLISELFENLKKHEAFREMTVICKLVLNRFRIIYKSGENICQWLIKDSLTILTIEHTNETLLKEIIHCLTVFITNYNYIKNVNKLRNLEMLNYGNNLYKNMIKITSEICLHSAKPSLRLNCLKLLEFVLSEFFEEEKVSNFSTVYINKSLQELPEDVEQWPSSNSDIFFCICHVVVWYSRMIWKEQDVLNAISVCFYNRRQSLQTFILKSIYFLYPVLITTQSNFKNNYYLKVMGDDLLNYFLKFSTASHLYSYNNDQLNWMLTGGSTALKLTVLCQWINTIKDEEILASAIQACHVEPVLLDLLLDNNVGQNLGSKLASILRKIKKSTISKDIAMMLPLTVDKPIIFSNLILSEPGVPEDPTDAELLCSLMGAIMPTIKDTEVLKCACKFSSKLLATLQDNPNNVKAFCKNPANMRHLIEITKSVEEDVSIEIIRLFKVVLIVQQCNKIKLDYTIEHDFTIFFDGSPEKIDKSLRLLYYVVAYKHSLIFLDEKSILGIYNIVLDCSTNPIIQDVAYECITMLLKRIPCLNQNINTIIHIEMSCLSVYDPLQVKSFLKMLDVWLKILRKEPYNGYCPIPEQAIKAFILRASLNHIKVAEYFTIIEELMNKRHVQIRGHRASKQE